MPLPLILGGIAIATAATGAKKAYDGYQDKSEADDIVKNAKSKYDRKKSQLEKANESTQSKINELGELYLTIGQDFKTFEELADELLNKLNQHSNKHLEINLPQFKLNQIKTLSMNSVAYAGKLVGGAAGGAAAAYAVYGGTMALAAASTGTPIAALSGVAAYNATMAAIGGGSLAAGGLGMAGGAMILSGVVAAPVIAVAGWAFASHAKDALEKAKEIRTQVAEYESNADAAIAHLNDTRAYVVNIILNVKNIHLQFKHYLKDLQRAAQLIRKGSLDTIKETDTIIQSINNGYALAAILTDIIQTPIFKLKKENGKIVYDENNVPQFEQSPHGNVLNTAEMGDKLQSSSSNARKY
ncbi:Uncharacterised protein [Moraxella caprae]|uniref:Chemotaxis protein n=1 Tax=Moraxella caprae TaxID=90240 RepID=A0A378QYQ5_9GAMM|nr:hypothetical protein [Moraxella caprae]STZ08055.1 Uncharacterised protein [Moraxella caprae]